MTERLAEITAGKKPTGVYRWRSRAHPASVRRELTAAGWTVHVIDGRAVADKTSLLDACAGALRLPSRSGRNWDAFADCVADLSWLLGDGHVLLWEAYGTLAAADPDTWRIAYGIFDSSVLHVLLRGTGPTLAPDGTPIPIL